MKFSTFIQVFIAALYNETQLTGSAEFAVGEIMDRYGLQFQPGWQDAFFKDQDLQRYVDARRHLGPIRQQRISISADGMRWIEDQLGENVATFLERHGAIYNSDPEFFPENEEVSAETPHDSSLWTGAQFVLVDAKVIAVVKERAYELRDLVNSMHFSSNVESSNLKGLADALVGICEMAEPEVNILDRILSSPKFQAYASIVALIATIRGAIGF